MPGRPTVIATSGGAANTFPPPSARSSARRASTAAPPSRSPRPTAPRRPRRSRPCGRRRTARGRARRMPASEAGAHRKSASCHAADLHRRPSRCRRGSSGRPANRVCLVQIVDQPAQHLDRELVEVRGAPDARRRTRAPASASACAAQRRGPRVFAHRGACRRARAARRASPSHVARVELDHSARPVRAQARGGRVQAQIRQCIPPVPAPTSRTRSARAHACNGRRHDPAGPAHHVQIAQRRFAACSGRSPADRPRQRDRLLVRPRSPCPDRR